MNLTLQTVLVNALHLAQQAKQTAQQIKPLIQTLASVIALKLALALRVNSTYQLVHANVHQTDQPAQPLAHCPNPTL